MRRTRLVSVLVAAIVAAACGSTGGGGGTSGNSYAGKTIKLGAVLSITGAGGVYGPQSRDRMNLAVDQINKAGGANGAQISPNASDASSLQTQPAQVAHKRIQSHPSPSPLRPN